MLGADQTDVALGNFQVHARRAEVDSKNPAGKCATAPPHQGRARGGLPARSAGDRLPARAAGRRAASRPDGTADARAPATCDGARRAATGAGRDRAGRARATIWLQIGPDISYVLPRRTCHV